MTNQGKKLAQTVDRVTAQLRRSLTGIHDPCITDVGLIYLREFRVLGTAAVQAEGGQKGAMRSSLDRAADLEFDARDRLLTCDLGLSAEQLAEVVDVTGPITRLYATYTAMANCTTVKCVRTEGSLMEQEAIRALGRYESALKMFDLGAQPARCQKITHFTRGVLKAFREIGRAARLADPDGIERARKRGYRLINERNDQLRRCLAR